MYSWPVVCHIFIVCWLTVGYHVINGPSVILGIQPSPSFDRLAHQRSKIGQSIPSLPVSARLGGFVKNPASLDRSNNGGQNLQSSVDKGIRKSIRKSPEKYGPSPPPLCSFIAGKNTGGKVSDKQSFPATVTVKRPIILGKPMEKRHDDDIFCVPRWVCSIEGCAISFNSNSFLTILCHMMLLFDIISLVFRSCTTPKKYYY